MTFFSILFARAEDSISSEMLKEPACFGDLNLDQLVAAITAGKQEYHLAPFFYTPLKDLGAITYRHKIMQDLEDPELFALITSFAQRMRRMRDSLAQAEKLYYPYQKERWFLDAVAQYCTALTALLADLARSDVQSRGLRGFRDYVAHYVRTEHFLALQAETQALQTDLSTITYSLIIKGNTVKVRAYEGESDYSVDVMQTFEKFKRGAGTDYRVKFSTWPEMNHVEARILEMVAQLYPAIFHHLDQYCAHHRQYQDAIIATFDQEIQFYLAYLTYIARFKRKGLSFCYPHLSNTSKEIAIQDGFDLTLADKLLAENVSVVCNDFSLHGKERILVVSGPNQGGKTTFARAFGQMHYLASLGCPVPGKAAHLFLCDQLFTHFEREESLTTLSGKLQDELIRMNTIFHQATSNSLIIINEIFTSTTINDAVLLGKKIMERLLHMDVVCVCVTFIDELASLSEKTVSMVSTIVPDNPAVRTYTIVRKPADGLAYALAIAEKYRLTYQQIKERIPS